MSTTVDFYFPSNLNSWVYKSIGSEPCVNKNNKIIEKCNPYSLSSSVEIILLHTVSDIFKKKKEEKKKITEWN